MGWETSQPDPPATDGTWVDPTWDGRLGVAAAVPDVEWVPVANIRGPSGPAGPPGPAGALADASNIPELAIVADLDDVRDLSILFENGMI